MDNCSKIERLISEGYTLDQALCKMKRDVKKEYLEKKKAEETKAKRENDLLIVEKEIKDLAQRLYEANKKFFLLKGLSEEEASALAASVVFSGFLSY